MSVRSKILLGLLGVAVLSGIAAFFFLRHQVIKSFPQTSGSTSVTGLDEAVRVYRDEFGVPLVEAVNEHDLMFALGYVHAQDRLWQMDMARRVGAGRLSEVFGAETLPFDRMFRILGLWSVCKKIEEAMSNDSRNRLAWYADGVNAFIATHKGEYPVEFDMLNYEPEPWQPAHSILIGRLMAWELNLSWWSDLTLGAIAEKVGLEKAVDVFPSFPRGVQPIVPDAAWHSYATLAPEFLDVVQASRALFGYGGTLGGSNAWVVAPQKSASGEVILANDTHLQLQSPSKFYEVQLRAPGYDVGGMSIPGIPAIVVGQNKKIVWGLTNVMADDADFYIEQIDTTGVEKYYYNKEWLPVIIREEEIKVKNDTTMTLRIRSTHHGPIVTDIQTRLRKAELPFVASMRWTGFEISDQFSAFNKINRAGNWEEFTAGVKEFSGPGQNFVYGDVNGNIGYWCGVWLPVRGKQNTTMPLSGWEPSHEWKGYVPFDRLPHLYNPPEGYIATANNKIVDDNYPYHISDLWEPPSRIQRLREVLNRDELFSVGDFERLQNDKVSIHAREVMNDVLPILADSAFAVENKQLLLDYFHNWTFTFNKEDVATSIYQQFFTRLLENIYKDEMGDGLFHDFVVLVNIPVRVTQRLLEEETSTWFDDVSTTNTVETRDDIVRKSMKEAAEALRGRMGAEMKNWRWGELHTVTLQHPFGLRKPLDKIFNIGPFPYGGGATSLVSGEYSFNDPFAVTVGASLRQVTDMARPFESRRILPTGQSGQVLQKHYDDQSHFWLNGAYHTTTSVIDQSGAAKWECLQLEPAR